MPWVNSVLGRAEFHKSKSKTAIVREEMPIFLLTLYDSTSKKYLIFCEIYFATCSFPQFPEKEINIFDGGVI